MTNGKRLSLIGAGGKSLVASLLLLTAGSLRADTIELLNGGVIEGTATAPMEVVVAHWDNVQYKLGKGTTAADGATVLAVNRDSGLLQSPRDALEAGDHAKAIRELSQVVGSKAKDWEQGEAKYLLGRAYYRSGKLKDAEKTLKEYLDKYRAEKDWFVPFATFGLAEVLLKLKQPGTAEVRFKELLEFKGQWEHRSKIGQAETIIAAASKEKYLDARRLLDEVAKGRDVPPALKQQAIVARAQVFLLQGQPQQVIKELGDEFFEAPKEIVYSGERAEATLLVGKAYLTLGGKENLEQAEIWLLKVAALYKKFAETYNAACDLLVEAYDKQGNKTRSGEWRSRKVTAAANGGGPEGASK
jgi:tetratricopeptide (TPR) repeat protein